MAGMTINEDKKRAHFTFIWTIKNAPTEILIRSRTFTVQSMENTKWTLLVWICKDRRVNTCIERAGKDEGPKSIEVEFEFSFLDTNGSALVQTSCKEGFQNYTSSRWFEFLETDVVPKQKRAKFCPKVTLTIRCRIWRTRTEISKSELCFASTSFDVHKYSSLWPIEGFSSLQQGEKRVRTMNRTSEGWPQLILTLSLDKKDGKEYIFIEREEPDVKYQYNIEAEVAVINNEGMDFLSKRVSLCAYKSLSVCEKDELMSSEAVLLSEDVLLLRFEIQVSYLYPTIHRIEDYKLMDYSSSETVRTKKGETHLEEANETAVCPFKEIVNTFKADGTFSDVCLQADHTSFPVHKLILSGRSPVFKAMFTKDMREKTSKRIDIPDLDADTLNRLLLYVYEGKIKKLTWETAANLFEAADKYELLDLKEKCSSFLKSSLTVSNVCDILVLAEMHQDESLRKSVQEFMQKNSEIIYSDGWKVFKENHSKLAWETAEEIIYKSNTPNLK